MDDDFEDYHHSDDDIDDKTHSRLLANVLNLTNKQHVKKPSRTEPTLKVSEYDLVKSGKNLQLRELTKALKQRSHVETEKKVRSAERKAKTLPKPLEKPQADRIRRTVAYQNTKTQLDRWEPIVTSLRAASQIKYPLETKVNLGEDEKSGRWRMKSELEKALEALEPKVETFEVDTDEKYPLTMAEMQARRKEAGKLRAIQGYKEAKARRQNKIKSKKYHRIQRREKVKQQMKEFELLQKTDPEAALQKLDEIEKARAEERASLRHKSTGKWARSKQIRAKYDRDSRQVLAQQLAISRDLTQKLKRNSDSESDNEEQNSMKPKTSESSSNPWVNNANITVSKEVNDFVDGYRKYWDEMNSKQSTDDTQVKGGIVKNKNQLKDRSPADIEESDEESEDDMGQLGARNVKSGEISDEDEKFGANLSKNKIDCVSNEMPSTQTEKQRNLFITDERNGHPPNKKAKANIAITNKQKSWTEEVVDTKQIKINKRSKRSKSIDIGGNTNNFIVEDSFKKTNKQSAGNNSNGDQATKSSKDQLISNISKTNKRRTKKIKERPMSSTANWEVSTDIDTELIKLDNKLQKKLQDKYKAISKDLKTNYPTNPKKPAKKTKKRKRPDLTIPVKPTKPIIDEELNETDAPTSDNTETPSSSINIAKLKTFLDEPEPAENIDPDKFMRVQKTSELSSDIPNLLSFDDNEEGADQADVITEAFEDDDIADDFQRDKAAEVEKHRPKDVDLSLPGWGTWGGKNLKVPLRKRRRFMVKFPKQMHRKDKNKGDLIINENGVNKAKPHLVSEVPFPFRNVKDYEASIRAPIGNTFVPEIAFGKLIEPAVISKMGVVIEPMTEDILLKKKRG